MFLIPAHFENLIHSALTVQKFKIFEDPFKDEPLNMALRFQVIPSPC